MDEDSPGRDVVHDLFDAAYPRLVMQMLAICGDPAEAEDVVQEAFVKAVGMRGRFAAMDNPEGWLRTVALNQLRNRWRSAKVFRRVMPRIPGAAHPVELTPDRVAVITALRALDRSLREVVVLHHLGDLSVNEVSRTLGIPTGTVKARLVRGRALLATALADQDAGHSDTTEEARHG